MFFFGGHTHTHTLTVTCYIYIDLQVRIYPLLNNIRRRSKNGAQTKTYLFSFSQLFYNLPHSKTLQKDGTRLMPRAQKTQLMYSEISPPPHIKKERERGRKRCTSKLLFHSSPPPFLLFLLPKSSSHILVYALQIFGYSTLQVLLMKRKRKLKGEYSITSCSCCSISRQVL